MQYINSIKINSTIIEDQTYVSKLPIVKNLLEIKELKLNENITFFVGENGSGKSTILEAIALICGLNAEGGSKDFNFATQVTNSELYKYMTPIRSTNREKDHFFLRAESFYNVASEIDRLHSQQYYGGKSLHDQSHGESFLALIQNRFRGEGLYILDEPEAALSPTRQLTLMCEMNRLIKNKSQFIIATHSPILLAFPKATIYEVSGSSITEVSYKDCEPYKVTKSFLDDPDRMLHYLLQEG